MPQRATRFLFAALCLMLLTASATQAVAQRMRFLPADSIVLWQGGGIDVRAVAMLLDPTAAPVDLTPQNGRPVPPTESLLKAWQDYAPSLNAAGGMGNLLEDSQILAAANNLYLAALLLSQTADAQWADAIERAACNALLRPVVFLEAAPERHVTAQALLASLHTCIGTAEKDVYLCQFPNGTAHVATPRLDATLDIVSHLPLSPRVKIRLHTAATPEAWTLHIRRPGWMAEGEVMKLYVNGHDVTADVRLDDGFLGITRTWRSGDEVFFDLPYEPRLSDRRLYVGPYLYLIEPPLPDDFSRMHLDESRLALQFDDEARPLPLDLPTLRCTLVDDDGEPHAFTALPYPLSSLGKTCEQLPL